MAQHPCREARIRGYRPDPQALLQYSRRDFLKTAALAAGGLYGSFALPGLGTVPRAWGAPPPERVVRVHCGTVQDWDFSDPQFYNHVKLPVMRDMFARGLCALTGEASVLDAWRELLVGYEPGHRVAIKLNLNSGDYNANQTCEMAYVVIDSLKQFGVPAQNMKVLDVVRRFPDYWRERWNSDVDYVNQDSVVWDPEAQVYFPAIDVWHRFPTVLSQAEHVINLALQKGHKGYVTGSMKNHFGSQEDPEALHIERFDNICQLAASPFIAGRTRLIAVEGSFMTWHHEGYPFEETLATDLFPAGPSGHSSPNFMMLGTNMVAMDSVLGDIQNYERAARDAAQWPNEFIDMAALPPYNLGPRDRGQIVPNAGGWSGVDLSYAILEYLSFDLPPVDRRQIDAANLRMKSGEIHWSQLQHIVERYEDRL